MPYANISWIKLKLELLNDKRFIFDLNNDQKWLFVGLLLLAGATSNKIPNDEKYLKNRLNLPENDSVVRENMAFLLKTFPKLIHNSDFLKFKNFNKLHNRIGDYQRNSIGTPLGQVDKIDKSRIDLIRIEYITIKGFALEDFTSSDFGRTAKAIKTLLLMAKDDTQVVAAIKWVSEQNYIDWTLETVIKKWQDFLKIDKQPDILKKFGKTHEKH